ncbi:MAG: stage V sporulation protein D, partial [Oscillospiraceae bacterium]
MAVSKKTIAKKKSYIVFIIVMLMFVWAVCYLFRWQVVRGEELKTRAMDQSLRTTALSASRGTIYDATGDKILAQSASVWTVTLEPAFIETEADREKIADGLSEILEMDREKVLEKTKEDSYFS